MDDFVSVLFCLGTLIGMFYVMCKISNARYMDNEPKDNLDFNKCNEDIEDLFVKKNQVLAIEKLLTDVNTCSPEHQKGFTLMWESNEGGRLEYEFWLDGTDTNLQDALSWLATTERASKRIQLQNKIQNTAYRSIKEEGTTIYNREEFMEQRNRKRIERILNNPISKSQSSPTTVQGHQ